MDITTDDSGIDDLELHDQLKLLVKQALTKVNPSYVALFEKIGGKISIEEKVYGGSEYTVGMCRYPTCIALKTTELISEELDRTLTEEIIHYLDNHLKFSDNKKFRMQEVADTDAQNPLSLAMLLAVRAGTIGMTSLEEEMDRPNLGMMIEFNKELPFLGVYHNKDKTDKYEWLAEVEHAEETLSRITNGEQARVLFERAQKNMPTGLILRFLSNHDINFPVVAEEVLENPENERKIWDDFIQHVKKLYHGKDFTGWIEEMARKVDVSDKVKTDEENPNDIMKINLAFAYHLLADKQYPLSEIDLRRTMISLFPESYYTLRSFRDEVDRELQKLNREDSVRAAIELVNTGGDLRKHLATSSMDEVALSELASQLQNTHQHLANAINATLSIHELIKRSKPDEEIPVVQITTLLPTAWPELSIDGKTVMEYATEREFYELSNAIKRFTSKPSFSTPPLPPH